jgi:hypothetical protein
MLREAAATLPEPTPQVMGRVGHLEDGSVVCWLNSNGKSLPDNAPLYAALPDQLETGTQLEISGDTIEMIFLANGFTRKLQEDGNYRLNDYVFAAARALIAHVNSNRKLETESLQLDDELREFEQSAPVGREVLDEPVSEPYKFEVGGTCGEGVLAAKIVALQGSRVWVQYDADGCVDVISRITNYKPPPAREKAWRLGNLITTRAAIAEEWESPGVKCEEGYWTPGAKS